MSTYVGRLVAGIPGGVLASLSLACPSVIIILIISKFLQRFRENRLVDGAFYGLRPASIAMISAALLNVVRVALIRLSAYTETGRLLSILRPVPILMAIILFISMRKLKWHPIVFLAISAVIGIFLKL